MGKEAELKLTDDASMDEEDEVEENESTDEEDELEHSNGEDESDDVLQNMVLMFNDDGDEEDHASTARNRKKGDLFHKWQILPLGLGCPVRWLVLCLVIHGSTIMNEKDYEHFKRYLLLTETDIESEADLMEHFYFNREKWRVHVKMCTPPAGEHAENICSAHAAIRDDPVTNKYYCKELKEFCLEAGGTSFEWGV